ncbi:unnamed protein product [Brassica oleracea var. botrytis]
MSTMRAPNKNGPRKLKSYPLLAAQKVYTGMKGGACIGLISFHSLSLAKPLHLPLREDEPTNLSLSSWLLEETIRLLRWLSSRRKSLIISLSVCLVDGKGLLSLYVDLLESEGSIFFRGGSRRRSIFSLTPLNGDGALCRRLSDSFRQSFSFMFFNDSCLRLSKA